MLDNHMNCTWLDLKSAAQENDIDRVCFLISQNCVSLKNISSALSIAASYGHLQLTRVLIDSGANVDNYCWGGTTLTEAVNEGHIEIVRLLLNAGANTSLPEYGEVPPPLTIAAEKGDLELVKLLIEAGANINQVTDDSGNSAINAAASAGQVETFNYLSPLSNKDLRDEATLILPEGIRNRELEENANPLVVELTHAVMQRDIDEVIKIIDMGVDVNGINSVGSTALFFAVIENSYSIVKIILEASANPNLGNIDENETPLMAVREENICSILIDAGADVNIKSNEGETALSMAKKRGDLAVVIKLIAANAI
jgi:uncharacterized protein